VFDVPSWWCCINPVERGVLRSTALAYVASLGTFVPEDVWITFWGLEYRSRNERIDFFIPLFFLLEETIPIGDPIVDTSVLTFTNDAFWMEVTAYLLNPDSACLDGCQRRVFA